MTKRMTALGTATIASVLAALALATWSTATAAPSRLVGKVGPGDTIALTTASGKRVSVVGRGTYSLTVRDGSDEHNFFLSGPGLRKQVTGVGFVGTNTVKVTLRPGRYTFVCTPHSGDMRGGFSVR